VQADQLGLGVESNLSDDGAHMLGEMTASDALALATRGGAREPARTYVGHLASDMHADVAVLDMSRLRIDGSTVQDPVEALMPCQNSTAAGATVNGWPPVRDRLLLIVQPGGCRKTITGLQVA
jgi:8-oxoguanine deaminase